MFFSFSKNRLGAKDQGVKVGEEIIMKQNKLGSNNYMERTRNCIFYDDESHQGK